MIPCPDDVIFVCIHLYSDRNLQPYELLRGDDAESAVWCGDMLCEACVGRDTFDLAREGLLITYPVEMLEYEEEEVGVAS